MTLSCPKCVTPFSISLSLIICVSIFVRLFSIANCFIPLSIASFSLSDCLEVTCKRCTLVLNALISLCNKPKSGFSFLVKSCTKRIFSISKSDLSHIKVKTGTVERLAILCASVPDSISFQPQAPFVPITTKSKSFSSANLTVA